MKLPKIKIIFKYLGEDKPLGQYYDYGARKGNFGVKPHIIVNFSILSNNTIKKNINIFWCLFHEFWHFLNRPLPEWLERLIDISIDVASGNHKKDIVYDLFKIFNKYDKGLYGTWELTEEKSL